MGFLLYQGVLEVHREPQSLCFFSCLAIVTRSIDIDFQRECMFSLSSLVSLPAPFPSRPAQEGLVLLTDFMHHFGLEYRKWAEKGRGIDVKRGGGLLWEVKFGL